MPICSSSAAQEVGGSASHLKIPAERPPTKRSLILYRAHGDKRCVTDSKRQRVSCTVRSSFVFHCFDLRFGIRLSASIPLSDVIAAWKAGYSIMAGGGDAAPSAHPHAERAECSVPAQHKRRRADEEPVGPVRAHEGGLDLPACCIAADSEPAIARGGGNDVRVGFTVRRSQHRHHFGECRRIGASRAPDNDCLLVVHSDRAFVADGDWGMERPLPHARDNRCVRQRHRIILPTPAAAASSHSSDHPIICPVALCVRSSRQRRRRTSAGVLL